MKTLAETHEEHVQAARQMFAEPGLEVGPIDTVVQDEDGQVVAYEKGSEPAPSPTGALKPFVPVREVAPGEAGKDGDKATKKEPAPSTIAEVAESLGLHEAEDLDDRAPDTYTSWLPFRDAPLFFFDLDDAMCAHHTAEVLTIEQSKLAFSQAPKTAKTPTPEQIAALLDEKSQQAESIGAHEVSLTDWVLDQAYRGCSKVRDWRRLPKTQKKVIADAILRASTVGQSDAASLMMR